MIYVYHHPNIGDHIIFNGMIRLYSEYSPITIFCLDKVKTHIEYMYRDNNNIHIVSFESESNILNFIRMNNISVRKYGWQPLFRLMYKKNSNLSFDECFYKLANIDFKIRFEKFHIERDMAVEGEVFEKHIFNNEKYIYVHDNPDLGLLIDSNKHRNDLKIVRNDMNYNIFQMRKILENATEIHTMQTGMLDFCNSIPLSCPIFVHLYVRKYPNIKFLSKSRHNLNLV